MPVAVSPGSLTAGASWGSTGLDFAGHTALQSGVVGQTVLLMQAPRSATSYRKEGRRSGRNACPFGQSVMLPAGSNHSLARRLGGTRVTVFRFWPFKRRAEVPVIACPPTLLVVEDDPQTRALLQGFLAELGFAAHFVSDGEAVLTVLEKSLSPAAQAPGRVDMVMIDLEARRRSGLDILVTVRRNRWRMPVVLTSPFVSSMLRAEVVRMGAVAILSRPVSLQELEVVLRRIVFPGRLEGRLAGS